MEYLDFIYYAFLRLRLLDVEINPVRRRAVPAVCRIFCSNVRGLAGNLSDLTVASAPGFSRPVLCLRKIHRARRLTADGDGAFRQPKFELGCFEILFFRVCGVKLNLMS